MPWDTSHPLYVLAVLALCVALSEWLVRRTALRHLGSALLVIVVTAVAANAGILPTYSGDQPIYAGTFDHLAKLGVFWLLMRVNLRDVLRAGASMLGLFLVGCAGTTAGVLVGMWAVDGATSIGELHEAIGGMFVGTYTGGSLNFNALADAYGVNEEPALYAGANAVDSIMTTVWMALCIVIPRGLQALRPRRLRSAVEARETAADAGHADHDVERAGPADLALLVSLGAGAVFLSERVALELAGPEKAGTLTYVVLTLVALALAQVPAVNRLRGSRLLGMLAIYVFLAVIGTLCDLAALGEMGRLAPTLSLFVAITVLVHGATVFGAAALLRLDWDVAAVASQANVGGGTSALALARSLDRSDLVLPAILVGSLGTALGTFLGLFTAETLLG